MFCVLEKAGLIGLFDAGLLGFTSLCGAVWVGVKVGRYLEWIDPIHTAHERFGVRHPRAGRFWT